MFQLAGVFVTDSNFWLKSVARSLAGIKDHWWRKVNPGDAGRKKRSIKTKKGRFLQRRMTSREEKKAETGWKKHLKK